MSRQYKYDMHIHSAETSKCGRIDAVDLVNRYKAQGYDGIAITDHLHESYINLLYCRQDWNTCVDRFLDGYRRAKEYGATIGFEVLLGMELRFAENDNDYLVYGVDENWLRQNPYPFRMGPQAFFERFKEELLIIHAHPYRDGNEFVRLDCVHGLEVVNSHPDHENRNELALAAYLERPELLPMAGSDAHRKGGECLAWVEFDRLIADSHQLAQAVRERDYRLGCKKPEDMALLHRAQEHAGNRAG